MYTIGNLKADFIDLHDLFDYFEGFQANLTIYKDTVHPAHNVCVFRVRQKQISHTRKFQAHDIRMCCHSLYTRVHGPFTRVQYVLL